jgi:hypothetical protein
MSSVDANGIVRSMNVPSSNHGTVIADSIYFSRSCEVQAEVCIRSAPEAGDTGVRLSSSSLVV